MLLCFSSSLMVKTKTKSVSPYSDKPSLILVAWARGLYQPDTPSLILIAQARGLFYKTLQIHIMQKFDRLCSKLVFQYCLSFSLAWTIDIEGVKQIAQVYCACYQRSAKQPSFLLFLLRLLTELISNLSSLLSLDVYGLDRHLRILWNLYITM